MNQEKQDKVSRKAVLKRLNLLCGFDTIDFGQGDIHDNDIRSKLLRHSYSFLTIASSTSEAN